MFNRIFLGEMRDKHGKYENEGKYGKRKCMKKGKYMVGKGREMWGSTLGEGSGAGISQQDFERGSAGENGKYGELKKVPEEKEVRECGTRHKLSNG